MEHTYLTNVDLSRRVRKWKTKLKEWNFEKYLSNRNMNIIVAKGKKRALEEGKDTIFVYHGSTIPASKIQNYSKRSKVARNSDSAPPCSAGWSYMFSVPFSKLKTGHSHPRWSNL